MSFHGNSSVNVHSTSEIPVVQLELKSGESISDPHHLLQSRLPVAQTLFPVLSV